MGTSMIATCLECFINVSFNDLLPTRSALSMLASMTFYLECFFRVNFNDLVNRSDFSIQISTIGKLK